VKVLPLASELLDELAERGFLLVDTYPYAARLGGELRRSRPQWWLEFVDEFPQTAGLALEQAAHFAFLGYCEGHPQWRSEMRELIASYLSERAPRYLYIELANTCDWYAERRGPDQEP
jgi:hypothetical protein